MRNLGEIAEDIETELDEKDTLREIALKSCRAIVRLSGAAISAMHKGDEPSSLIAEARDEVSKLKALVREHDDISSAGFVEAAYQEAAEACILLALLGNTDLPAPEDIDVTPSAYLLGMGDVVGELRRVVLDCLRHDNIEEAVKRLEQMEQIFEVLMRFDYPSALVGVRRKQDVARTIIEKTRGDVTVAVRSKRLEEKLGKLESVGVPKENEKKKRT